MDKTIKINLGGTLFNVTEEAYKLLKGYLQEINSILGNTPGAAETVEDIEMRIAEIFQSQGVMAGIISKENVENMISIIGKPSDFITNDEDKTTGEPYFSPSGNPKRLYRNPDDQIISGVSGGLGTFLNMDSVWVRILFILFACFFGIGFFVYIALWIALPMASGDAQKRDMYGTEGYRQYLSRSKGNTRPLQSSGYAASSRTGSDIGNAFNEIFRALGRVLFVIMRILLIITGISLVIAGFASLVSYILIFFFKFPGYFSTDAVGVKLFYLPDFLSYVVDPSMAPWIMALLSVVVILPLLALIYWGVRMIFWFRAKDGIISLVAIVIWVVSLAALSILLFSEGVGFAERSGKSYEKVIEKAPADLYIFAGKKVADLKYDKDITFDEEYTAFFDDDGENLYITSGFDISSSDDESLRIHVRKRSAGRSNSDAERKAGRLEYSYSVEGDTLSIDEYFSIPAGTKWSADEVNTDVLIPAGTRVHFDNTTLRMFRRQHFNESGWEWTDSDDDEYEGEEPENLVWIMTEDGLKKIK